MTINIPLNNQKKIKFKRLFGLVFIDDVALIIDFIKQTVAGLTIGRTDGRTVRQTVLITMPWSRADTIPLQTTTI